MKSWWRHLLCKWTHSMHQVWIWHFDFDSDEDHTWYLSFFDTGIIFCSKIWHQKRVNSTASFITKQTHTIVCLSNVKIDINSFCNLPQRVHWEPSWRPPFYPGWWQRSIFETKIDSDIHFHLKDSRFPLFCNDLTHYNAFFYGTRWSPMEHTRGVVSENKSIEKT